MNDGRVSARRLIVVGSGGTIQRVGRHGEDLVEYGTFGAHATLEDIWSDLRSAGAQLPEDVELQSRHQLSSSAANPQWWTQLWAHIRDESRKADPNEPAVVLTHGTATMEETAFFLDMTLDRRAPTVLVGSMRPHGTIGTDAQRNLVDAVRVALDTDSDDRGVMVVSNAEIHGARHVTKQSAGGLDAFASPGRGPLGRIDPLGRVTFFHPPRNRRSRPVPIAPSDSPWPRVDIVPAFAGADGALIDAALEHGAAAVVVAALLPGTVPPEQEKVMIEATRHAVVVLASRAAGGSVVLREKYRAHGVVCAHGLAPQKARIAAMVALQATHDPAEVQAVFDRLRD